MSKVIIVVVIIIILVGLGGYYIINKAPKLVAFDPMNASYTVEGASIKLIDGQAETEAAPGSVETISTRYFGNVADGDLNNDGVSDTAFLLMQDGGGTGVFFYVVAVLKLKDGYKTTDATFIGDRIAPQTTEIKDGKLIVNYADRRPDEPMSATPSIGVSRYFVLDGNVLKEVAN